MGLYAVSIVRGPEMGRVYPLEDALTVIGRDPGEGITLLDTSVSRRHARIVRHLNGYVVEDLGSRNGTLLNDQRLEQPQVLRDGDLISLGETTLRFSEQKHESDVAAAREFFNAAATISVDALRTEMLEPPSIEEEDVSSLRRAREALAAANRAAQAISAVLRADELYEVICRSVIDHIRQAEESALLLAPAPGEELVCLASLRRPGSQPSTSGAPVFSSTLARMALEERKALLVHDAMQDESLRQQDSIQQVLTRSVLCVPLALRTGREGVLIAQSHREDHPFTQDDLRLLAMIGMQASAALENAALYHQLELEKAALAAEHEKLKAAQQSLVQSERLAAVGRLAAEIVHDVRNPMTVILGHSQLLQVLLEKNPEKIDHKTILDSVREIENGVGHASRIVDQLLQFARQDKPDKTPTDLNDLAAATLRFVHPEIMKSKVDLQTDWQSDLPPVDVDPNQIRQVIVNMVMNAVQAMPPKGCLRVTTALDPGPPRRLLLRFQDNGCGMNEEQLARIFEPFFTTKVSGSAGAGGSGLGLSVSYGIVRNHGGNIDVQSEPGRGTLFTVALPSLT